jgi:hypothetical protein
VPDCPADWQATPEQVAADQRADVARAVRELGAAATVLRVSERTGLHPFGVVRRLGELGLSVPGTDWRPQVREKSAAQKAEGTRFLDEGRRARGKASDTQPQEAP